MSKNKAMINFATRLFVIFLILYVLSQFPGIIEVFVLLFQAVGGYALALIEYHPLFFAIGFLFIYGLGRPRSSV
jgi:hypothetical protein